MKIGYIYWAKAEKLGIHPHPMMILEINEYTGVTACILSHDSRHGNIAMDASHFYVKDENSNLDYKFKYENTCLAKRKFIKLPKDINVIPVGRITDEGFSFIDDKLDAVDPETLNEAIWCKKDTV